MADPNVISPNEIIKLFQEKKNEAWNYNFDMSTLDKECCTLRKHTCKNFIT